MLRRPYLAMLLIPMLNDIWSPAFVERLITSPYQAGAPQSSDIDTGRNSPPLEAITVLLNRNDVATAEKLLLAYGYCQAMASNARTKTVLAPAEFKPDFWSRLGHGRGRYVRLCTAAVRCQLELEKILGNSDLVNQVRHDVWTAAFGRSLYHMLFLERVARDDDVLILGETGTGKEAIATSLIAATAGGDDGLPAASSTINAAAIPETLVESELFGFVKGAFTGANENRKGRILSADGGCFFLDEVGDLAASTQAKLLRVLESDEVSPLGSDEVHHADIRFVAATHRDLEHMVDVREFRADLYQRLAGNIIRLPPLRDRPDDIVTIGMAFVRRQLPTGDLDELVSIVERWLTSPEVRSHSWPGNVRELQNTLRGVLLGVAAKTPRSAATMSRAASREDSNGELPPTIADGTATMEQVGDWYLERVLNRQENSLAKTARILGLDRSTVRRHLKRLDR